MSDSFKDVVSGLAHHYMALSSICYALPLAFFFMLYLSGRPFGVLDYMSTSYAVNYLDYGFVKRGLVGTILYFVPGGAYKAMAIGLPILGVVALVLAFSRAVERIECPETRNIIKLFFAISPFTMFQFGFEIGRLDIFNFLITLWCLYSVHKGWWISVLFSSVAALFIHEAFIAYGVPLVLGFALFTTRKSIGISRWLYVAVYLVCIIVIGLLIWNYGNSDLVVQEAPGEGHDAWSRPLLQPGFAILGWANIVIVTFLVIAIYAFLIAVYVENKGRFDALFLCSGGPLMLFALGWDYARWTSLLACVVLTIVVIKACYEGWKISPASIVYGGFAYLLPLGAVGTMAVFPMARSFLGAVFF